jgi:hypothetical protein
VPTLELRGVLAAGPCDASACACAVLVLALGAALCGMEEAAR